MTKRLLKKLFSSPTSEEQSYGDWWNANAETIEQAYASTIAPSTEADYQSRGKYGDENTYGAQYFVERCKLGKQSRVLEIGCGIARIGREMAPLVGEWHGADISDKMLQHARRRCAGLTNVRFHTISSPEGLSKLPGGYFDFVYMTVVLMHLDKEDVFHYLQECFRMLRKGGQAYFDTWNLLHPDTFRIWREGARIGNKKVRGRMQCSTPGELKTFAENAGFCIDTMEDKERMVRVFCRKEKDVVPLIQDDEWPPFGYVEKPENLTACTDGQLVVTGWCLDQIAKVDVYINSAWVANAEYGGNFPEVARAFPRYHPQAGHCRFTATVSVNHLASGEHTIKVEAEDKHGERTVITRPHHIFVIPEGSARSASIQSNSASIPSQTPEL